MGDSAHHSCLSEGGTWRRVRGEPWIFTHSGPGPSSLSSSEHLGDLGLIVMLNWVGPLWYLRCIHSDYQVQFKVKASIIPLSRLSKRKLNTVNYLLNHTACKRLSQDWGSGLSGSKARSWVLVADSPLQTRASSSPWWREQNRNKWDFFFVVVCYTAKADWHIWEDTCCVWGQLHPQLPSAWCLWDTPLLLSPSKVAGSLHRNVIVLNTTQLST